MKSKQFWTIENEDGDINIWSNGLDIRSPRHRGNQNKHSTTMVTCWHFTNNDINYEVSHDHKTVEAIRPHSCCYSWTRRKPSLDRPILIFGNYDRRYALRLSLHTQYLSPLFLLPRPLPMASGSPDDHPVKRSIRHWQESGVGDSVSIPEEKITDGSWLFARIITSPQQQQPPLIPTITLDQLNRNVDFTPKPWGLLFIRTGIFPWTNKNPQQDRHR